jgi:hypothetical protein
MGRNQKKIKWDTGAQTRWTTATREEIKHKIKIPNKIGILESEPTRASNKIIKGHIPQGDDTKKKGKRLYGKENKKQTKGDGRVLPRELLDDGQGKSPSDMEISKSNQSKNESGETAHKGTTIGTDGRDKHTLLLPPIIEATGKIATGATTPQLRKQNKRNQTTTLLQQPLTLQWQLHNGTTILPNEHWEKRQKTSNEKEMAPQGLAL